MPQLTVVTGGTRGIGAAIALRLAEAGHDLVLSYRSDDASAQKVRDRVRGLGRECSLVRADLCEPGGIDAVFEAARPARVSGLVNNAGATLHIGPLADTPVDIVRRVIDVNLTATVLCARRAVQEMATSRGGDGGVIVNISSGAATLGAAHEYVHYAAAKAGVDTLTAGLAAEVAADGIRVNAVAPGIVRTDIHADAGAPDRVERTAPKVPLGRAAEPEDVAAAVAWLFTEDASYVAGAVLRVAGGR
ncbi:MAG: SDR family NAD(P)-dependent oxidoreductase [Nocardioidaceae bacterium]